MIANESVDKIPLTVGKKNLSAMSQKGRHTMMRENTHAKEYNKNIYLFTLAFRNAKAPAGQRSSTQFHPRIKFSYENDDQRISFNFAEPPLRFGCRHALEAANRPPPGARHWGP